MFRQEEIQARRKGMGVTVVLVGLLSILLFVIKVFHGTIPPEDEVVYILRGHVTSEGSSSSQEQAAAPKIPTSQAPKVQKIPPTPPTTETASSEINSQEEDEEISPESLYQRGEEESTEEQGETTFFWGEGEEGLQGRIPLRIVSPEYLTEREAKIRFEMLVDASGEVKQVRALTLGAPPALRTAGIQAIQQWKFNPLPGSPDQRIVVTVVFRLR